MIGTETGSTVSTRGIYQTTRKRDTSADTMSTIYRWAGAAEEWWKVVCGARFPLRGVCLDGLRLPRRAHALRVALHQLAFRPHGHVRLSQGQLLLSPGVVGRKPVLYMLPHWNWPGREGQEMEIWVHSNLERVELFLNGQSQGSQNVVANSRLVWKVKYAPGLWKLAASEAGEQTLAFRRETTGAAAKIVLKPDRGKIDGNGEDIAMVAVEIQDRQGRVVPVADNEIEFKISGPGRLIGVSMAIPAATSRIKPKSARPSTDCAWPLCRRGARPVKSAWRPPRQVLQGPALRSSAGPPKPGRRWHSWRHYLSS